MTWIAALTVALGALLMSGLFSGAETGLYCINRLRLQLGLQQRDPACVRLSGIVRDEQAALSVMLIGTNVMNYITTVAVAYMFSDLAHMGDHQTELYTVIVLTPIVFVFAEVVPKNLFQRNADTLMARFSRLLGIATGVFRGVGAVWIITRISDVVTRFMPATANRASVAQPKRRMAGMLREALADARGGDEQSELVDRIVHLSETRVHTVMVPRNRVVTIAADADRTALVAVARRVPHARLPVYDPAPSSTVRTGARTPGRAHIARRRMIGLIKVDDLLARDDWETVADGLRPITTLTPHQTVAAAITDLQRSGYGMAVVTDRGGQMLGIVTFKDLIEELVGELTAW